MAKLKTAVPGHQQARAAVLLHTLLTGNEHGNARAVLGVVEDLPDLVLRGIEWNLRLKENIGLSRLRVVTVNRRRQNEGLEDIEAGRLLRPSNHIGTGADAGIRNLSNLLALQRID